MKNPTDDLSALSLQGVSQLALAPQDRVQFRCEREHPAFAVQQAEIDVGRGPAGALTTEEPQELSALRREVRQPRMDREI